MDQLETGLRALRTQNQELIAQRERHLRLIRTAYMSLKDPDFGRRFVTALEIQNAIW